MQTHGRQDKGEQKASFIITKAEQVQKNKGS